jgi:hypothetical protein
MKVRRVDGAHHNPAVVPAVKYSVATLQLKEESVGCTQRFIRDGPYTAGSGLRYWQERALQRFNYRAPETRVGGKGMSKTMSIRMDRDNHEFLHEITKDSLLRSCWSRRLVALTPVIRAPGAN